MPDLGVQRGVKTDDGVVAYGVDGWGTPPEAAAGSARPRRSSNHRSMRGDTSIRNLGSRGPCGVRGYTIISVATPSRESAT